MAMTTQRISSPRSDNTGSPGVRCCPGRIRMSLTMPACGALSDCSSRRVRANWRSARSVVGRVAEKPDHLQVELTVQSLEFGCSLRLIERDQYATGGDTLAGLDGDRRDGTRRRGRHTRSTLDAHHRGAGRIFRERAEDAV